MNVLELVQPQAAVLSFERYMNEWVLGLVNI